MMTIYKSTQEGIEEIHGFQKDCWVNLVDPTKQELDTMVQDLHIPLDFLTDPLDVDERARVEVENKITVMILRVPIDEGEEADIRFTTLPLGIIFTEELMVTICQRQTNIISNFIKGNVKNFSTMKSNRFLFQIFLKTALLYLSYLKEINKKSTATEKELHVAMKNEELIKLLNLEKSLVYFTTALKSDELMIERLQKMDTIKMDVEDKDLLEDVTIEYKQAIEMTNVYSNILSGMMDAFASVISNNLNVVLKFLTSVTIILMIPTLIASIYGMNLEDLPFKESPYAFLIIMGISFILSIIGVFVFMVRKWF
ncbi:MAG: magnesium transporter CorA family protein [Methanobacteriota archaeon]